SAAMRVGEGGKRIAGHRHRLTGEILLVSNKVAFRRDVPLLFPVPLLLTSATRHPRAKGAAEEADGRAPGFGAGRGIALLGAADEAVRAGAVLAEDGRRRGGVTGILEGQMLAREAEIVRPEPCHHRLRHRGGRPEAVGAPGDQQDWPVDALDGYFRVRMP